MSGAEVVRSAEPTQDDLARWLEAREREDDPLIRVELFHVLKAAPGGAPAFVMLSDYSATSDHAHTAGEAWHDAAIHAANYRGEAQQFFIRAFRRSDPAARVGQFSWTTETGDAEAFGITTPVGNTELLGIMARHLEAKERITAGVMGDVYTLLRAELGAKDARISHLEAQRLEGWEAMDELIGARREQEIETTKQLRAENRKDEALQSLKLLMPAIGMRVSKALGAELRIQPGTELASIKELFASFTPQQLDSLLNVCSTPQKIAVMEWLQRVANAVSETPSDDEKQTH